MKILTIFVGSVLGGTEFVADRLAEKAEQAGYQVEVVIDYSHWQYDSTDNSTWLICTSTHGGGDIPDNMQSFVKWLQNQPVLSHKQYGIIGIGDSSYDTFCFAAKKLQTLMKRCNAKQSGHSIFIDVQKDPMPEDPAMIWFDNWLADL